MHPPSFSRRHALKTLGGALAVPFLGAAALRAADAPAKPAPTPTTDATRAAGLRLGVTTYSLRELTLDAALSALQSLRISHVALFKNHCNWETASVDECRAVGEKVKAAGLTLTGTGVVNLPNDEAKCRRAFDNIRAAGVATLVCKPSTDAFPLIERLVKEYDQPLAIHNHGPEDQLYPSPYDALKQIESLDPRIGLCVDVGHTMRAHVDPIEAIHRCAARIRDLHLKDSLAVPGTMKDIPTEVGTGGLDIPGILKALRAIHYPGVVTFEYEKIAGNPVIGLAESVGYVRGVLKAQG